VEQLHPDFTTGDATPVDPINQTDVDQAIASYQVASYMFKHGLLVRRPTDSTPVQPASGSSVAPTPAAASTSSAPASP
jgi:hypothetical protein